MQKVISIHNIVTKEFFYSTNHCQQLRSKIRLSDSWVPCTAYLPMTIVPRTGFEDGRINTVADYKRYQAMYGTEVPNPDPLFSVK